MIRDRREGGMRRRALLGAFPVVLLCLVAWSAPAFAEPLVTIASFQWTDSVNRSSKQYAKELSSPAKTKKLYLWMQLRGSPELLEKLRQSPDGRLPIRHEWYWYGPDALNADMDVVIPLRIGRKDDLRKLAYEVDAKGYFHWRIWSGKTNLRKGWWRVDVVDEFGEPLLCTDGEATKPCIFQFRVQ